MASRKTYVVAGATGSQGGATARHLKASGHRVIGITHTPSKAARLESEGIEPLVSDLRDPTTLVPNLKGVDGLFVVTVPSSDGAGSFDWAAFEENEIRQGEGALRAADAAHVPHVVLSTVASACQSPGVSVWKSKTAIEAVAEQLGVPRTILRPPFFMGSWLPGGAFFPRAMSTGVMELPVGPDTAIPHIEVDDVGRVAAWAFSHPEQSVGEAWELAGEVTTYPEIVRTLSRRWSRPFAYREVPPGEENLSLPPPLAKGFAEVFAVLERHAHRWDARVWESKFGFRMTSFEEYLHRRATAP